MTAKEVLREWVEGLTEAEAAERLRQVEHGADEAATMAAGSANADRLLALFARWDSEGPSMTEEEWNTFAADLEEDRLSYRKRFA